VLPRITRQLAGSKRNVLGSVVVVVGLNCGDSSTVARACQINFYFPGVGVRVIVIVAVSVGVGDTLAEVGVGVGIGIGL